MGAHFSPVNDDQSPLGEETNNVGAYLILWLTFLPFS